MENKEWESFAQYLKSKGVVKIGRNVLGAITNLVRESGCSLGYNDIELMWDTWQGKSQITPEGFVLVRKELPEEIAEAMALERVEKPVTETDLTWIKISQDAYKGRIQSKKWELWRDYKAMIEAQEQSHGLD